MSFLLLRCFVVGLVALASWQISGWLLLRLYQHCRPSIGQLAPAARARLLLWIAAAPALVGAAVCLLLFVAPHAPLVPQHCHGGHGCGAHAPVIGALDLHLPAWGLGLSLGAALIASLLLLAWISQGHRRKLNWMVQAHDRRGFGVLDTELPVALTAGMVAPGVYLSRGLVESVSAEQLAIILAHEQAHVTRRDNLRRSIAECLLPQTGRHSEQLRRDLRVAAEESADQHCAARGAGALQIADTLITVERLGQRAGHVAGCGFTDADLVQRVATLLRPPRYRALELPWFLALVTIGTAQVLLTTQLVHHLIESAVSFIQL